MSITDLLKLESEGKNITVRIVWQERLQTSPVKLKSVLADTKCHPGDAVVNAETGFYVVAPTKSVIFVSPPESGRLDKFVMQLCNSLWYFAAGSDKIIVELVVLRGIAQSSEHAGALYEWASTVVAHACHDRRNVRVRLVYFKFCST
jgi:hypothetical protein